MSSFQTFLEEHALIEGLLQSMGRTINPFNIKAYQGAVEEYKKKIQSGEKVSHGVLIHRLASMYNVDARSLDEILSRMIKSKQIQKASQVYITPDSDREMTRD